MSSTLPLLAITWDVSPAIFTIGTFELRWYAILFAVGLFVFGPWIVHRIWQKEGLPEPWFDKLFWYVAIGTIVGARLGHCLFYDPLYYLANPVEILKTWEGGLASHGGVIGLIIVMWIYARKVSHKPILWGMDRLCVPVGLVAAMIRLGNLMNSEIFGYPTDVAWGFRFVRSAEWQTIANGMPCHPTAIYEALAYLLVFAICMWLYWRRNAGYKYHGLIVGTLLTLTFVARILIETVKFVQEPWEHRLVDSIGLNQGQLLSIPFILIGVGMIIYALRHPVPQAEVERLLAEEAQRKEQAAHQSKK